MFFSKKKVILYFRKNSLELYTQDGRRDSVLEITDALFKNNQVVDANAFKEEILSFIAKSDIGRAEGIVLFSEDIVFKKALPRMNTDTQKLEIETFFNDISSKLKDLSKNLYTLDHETILVAVDKKLSAVIHDAAHHMGWDILSVVPISLLGISFEGGRLTPEELKQISKKEKILHLANLLNNEEEITDTPVVRKNKNVFFYLVCGIVVVVLIAFFLYVFNLVKIPYISSTNPDDLTIKVLPTSEAFLSPTDVPSKDKNALTIQVLNGTGIVGQAGKVKSLLTSVGYTNIESGNSSTKDTVETQIEFSKGVSKEVRDEVVKILKSMFGSISTKESNEHAMDIVITTGQP